MNGSSRFFIGIGFQGRDGKRKFHSGVFDMNHEVGWWAEQGRMRGGMEDFRRSEPYRPGWALFDVVPRREQCKG